MTDLPPGWEWTTLEELASPEPRSITDGPFGSNLKSSHYTASGARVFRLQNIGDGVFRDEKAYISLEHFEQLRAHEAREGDLLFASLGEAPPRACLVPRLNEPAIVKADCIRIRLSPHVDPQWVLYTLLSPVTKRHAGALIKGVGRPRLGLHQIRSIPVPLPPLNEQRRIVATLEDHLSRLDAGTDSLENDSSRLNRLTKRLLINAVPVEEKPAHWKMMTVAEAGTVDLGRQRHPAWHEGPNMRPYLRVANVFEDRIDLDDVMEMDFPPDVFERFRLREHDILLNEGQSPEYLGRPAMYRGLPPEVAFTNSLLRFRVSPDVDPEWALLVFRRHMHARRFIKEVRITTNIAHLSATRFKTVEFPVPPLDEQRAIVDNVREQLSALARLQSAIESAQAKARALRRSLLNDAFTGQLAQQDPDDEPASTLLARINAERAAQSKPKRTRKTKPVQETLL